MQTSVQTVLAATDFSEHAERAVQRAARLAAERRARLCLLHVVDPSGFHAIGQWLTPTLDVGVTFVTQAQAALDAQAQALRERHGIEVEARVVTGDPLEETRDAAAQADLLVLGAQGVHPVRALVVGPPADRLLRKSVRPLLVVKQDAGRAYRRVLVPVDFSPYSVAALQAALALAPQAAVEVFHVFDTSYEGKLRLAGVGDSDIIEHRVRARQDALERLNALVAGLGTDAQRISVAVDHGDVPMLLQHRVEQFAPDLVAIGKHGQSFMEDLLLGSVTRHVVAESACDVLVVPRGAGQG